MKIRKLIASGLLIPALVSLCILGGNLKVDAQTINENFVSADNFSTLDGTVIQNNSIGLNEEQVVLNENFDSYSNGTVPTGWTRDTTGWGVNTQTYYHNNANYDGSKTWWDATPVKNGYVTARITPVNGEKQAGIIFRAVDNQNFYLAAFSPLAAYQYIRIYKCVNGTWSTIGFVGNMGFSSGIYYRLTVLFDGPNLKAYITDNQSTSFQLSDLSSNDLKININDSTHSNAGKLGFYRNGTVAHFDDVKAAIVASSIGTAESISWPQAQNISKAKISAIFGQNLENAEIFLSNNNGKTWLPAFLDQDIYFEAEGDTFKYKIYFHKTGQNPVITFLNIDYTLGAKDTTLTPKSVDLTRLQYDSSGNSILSESYDPDTLEKYGEIPGVAFVQQPVIIFDGQKTIAYIPGEDHFLTAYDLTNKVTLWSTDLAGYLECSPYYKNGVLYLGSYDHNLYAIDALTGDELWHFTADNTISTSPIDIKGEVLYFTTYGYGGTTTAYAVNINTHDQVWSKPMSGTAYMAISVEQNKNVAYITFGWNVVAVDTLTGTTIWSLNLGYGYITKQATIYGDKILVGCDRGIAVLDSIKGGVLWKNGDGLGANEMGLGASPTVSDGIVYYPTKGDKSLYARNIADGSLVWKTVLDEGTYSSPVITTDGFIYESYNGGIRAFKQATGEQVWQSADPSWTENQTPIAHGYMLFVDHNAPRKTIIYKSNQATYQSTDGITLNRDDRNISSITVAGTPSETFGCNATALTERGAGEVDIEYGPDRDGTVKPGGMIINPLSVGGIHACYAGGTQTFTYDFGTTNFNEVYRDGTLLPKANWASQGSQVTITDTFSDHTYSLFKHFYNITPIVGLHGSINPTLVTPVDFGFDQVFTITPDEHYHIKDVLVDSTSVGAVSSYVFKNVTQNHTIEASFEINPIENIVQTPTTGTSNTDTSNEETTNGTDTAASEEKNASLNDDNNNNSSATVSLPDSTFRKYSPWILTVLILGSIILYLLKHKKK